MCLLCWAFSSCSVSISALNNASMLASTHILMATCSMQHASSVPHDLSMQGASSCRPNLVFVTHSICVHSSVQLTKTAVAPLFMLQGAGLNVTLVCPTSLQRMGAWQKCRSLRSGALMVEPRSRTQVALGAAGGKERARARDDICGEGQACGQDAIGQWLPQVASC
jgi:hypothetical protein